jgi:hypothetical protein
VNARRTDGNFIQSFIVGINRPRVGPPIITNINPQNDLAVCLGSWKTLGVTATNATTYNWSSPANLAVANPNSQNADFQPLANGKYTVTATVDNACFCPQSTTRTVFGGAPVLNNNSLYVNGGPNNTINFIYNPPALLSIITDETGVNASWSISGGNGNIYWNGSNFSRIAYPSPFMIVQPSLSNHCGSTNGFIYLQDVSGGYYRMVSENPNSGETIDIEMASTLIDRGLKGISLVSQNTNKNIRANDFPQSSRDLLNGTRRISINVNRLPRGLYYLNLSFEGDKNFTEQIILR